MLIAYLPIGMLILLAPLALDDAVVIRIADTGPGIPPEQAERITGVPERAIVKAAHLLGRAPRAMVLTARGPEQQTCGVRNALAYINVALALGLPGKPFSGYGTLTGQGNGQGGREHGQKADQLPGWRDITNPEHRRYIAGVWGVPEESLPGPGVDAYEIFRKIDAGEIKGLLTICFNPKVSLPDNGFITRCLEKLELYVAIDFFLNDTARHAVPWFEPLSRYFQLDPVGMNVVDVPGGGGGGTTGSAFLPAIYQGTAVPYTESDPSKVIQYLSNAKLPLGPQRRQVDLLKQLNQLYIERLESAPELEASIQSMEIAFRMQTSAPEVFDVRKESPVTVAMFGEGDFARGCLMARRLVENGVRIVQVFHGDWDHHAYINGHKFTSRQVDRTIAALRAIENGDASEENFTTVGNDWDIEERSRVQLDQLGLGEVDLTRQLRTLSGGQVVSLGLAAQLLQQPDVLLLDIELPGLKGLEVTRELQAIGRLDYQVSNNHSIFGRYMLTIDDQKIPYDLAGGNTLATNLPGRDDRWGEPPVSSMAEAVDLLLTALRGEDLSRSVFFGHSMGARIAHQMCVALARAGTPGPRALVVSSSPAPSAARAAPRPRDLSDSGVVDFVRRLNPEAATALEITELREVMLPTLRADLAVATGPAPHPDGVLDIPLHAFGGRSDPMVTVTDLIAWRDHTTAAFSLGIRPGGHFHHEEQPEELLLVERQAEGDVQLGFDPVAVFGDLAHLVGIGRPVARPRRARILQSEIGMPEQRNRVVAVHRHGNDAQRNAHRLEMRGQLIGLHQPVEQLVQKPFEMRLQRGVGKNCGELAGADAPDLGLSRQQFTKPPGEGADELVTLPVADRVVDMLHPVDVEVEQEGGLAAAQRARRRLGDLAHHGRAGVHPGQLVDLGLLIDIAFGLIDPGEEGHRRQRGRKRTEARNDPTDDLGRHPAELTAESGAHGPQGQHEAAYPRCPDGQQPECLASGRAIYPFHTVNPRFTRTLACLS